MQSLWTEKGQIAIMHGLYVGDVLQQAMPERSLEPNSSK